MHGNQRPSPAAFWLRNKQKVLSHVGPVKTLGSRPQCTPPAGPCIADPNRPLGTIHERERCDLRGNARTAGLGRPTATGPDAGNNNADFQLSPTQPVSRRSKAASTVSAQPLQVKSPPPDVSGRTVAQASLEPDSSPHHVISRLLLTSA